MPDPPYDLEETLKLMHDPRWHWRVTAAARLEDIPDPRSVDALIVALTDENGVVWSTACDSLLTLREIAVEPLIEALHSPNDVIRSRAAYVLGHMRESRAVDALIQILNDPIPKVRCEVIWALGEIRDPRVGGPLLNALLDSTPIVRQSARTALLWSGRFDAITPLSSYLNDPSEWVQLLAAHLLEVLGTPEAMQAVADWKQKRTK